MTKHGKQHFIPASYLAAWVDPSCPKRQAPYVWLFNKDGTGGRRKAPENIFHERDIYTIRTGERDRELVLEQSLSGLEHLFAKVRRACIEPRGTMTEDEHFTLCCFVAAMQARTPTQREHVRKQWRRHLELMDEHAARMKSAIDGERAAALRISRVSRSRDGPSLSHDQVREIVKNPMQTMLFPQIKAAAPLLQKLDLVILEADDEIGFITSDRPCIWFDPEAPKRPPMHRAPALMYPTIEITLPVSPTRCLLFNRRGVNGYSRCSSPQVDVINRRVCAYANQFIVVQRNQTRSMWFS
jgi:hypothetical protein